MYAHKHIHQPDTCLRFYVRMAAIARKIYLNKNAGVGQLAKVTPDYLSSVLNSVVL
jgi:ribosomal protein S19E (S16A)